MENLSMLDWPKGNVFQRFAANPQLYRGTNGHTGEDYVKPEGEPILACLDSIVVEMRNNPNGYGEFVRLVSNEQDNERYLEQIYGHMRNIPDYIVPGYKIKAGECLGYESNTGYVISGNSPFWGNAPAGIGVHLHLGFRWITDPKPNTTQICYSNRFSYTILNYENQFFGYIDPAPFFLKNFSESPQTQNSAITGIIVSNVPSYPVDDRYGRPKSILGEMRFNVTSGLWLKKRGIKLNSQEYNALIYGGWALEEVKSPAMIITWREHSKSQFQELVKRMVRS